MKKSCLLIVFSLIFGAGISAQSSINDGNIAYGAGEFSIAISHYERAIMTNSNDLNLLLNLAHSYRLTNEMAKAEKNYEAACKNPAIPNVNYYYYGTVLMANKNYDKAKAVFQKFGAAATDLISQNLAKEMIASCDFAKNNQASASAFFVKKETGISSSMYDDYAPVFHNGDLIFTSSRKVTLGPPMPGFSNPDIQNFLYRTKQVTSGQLAGITMIAHNNGADDNTSPFAITTDESKGVSTYGNKFKNGVRHVRGTNLHKLSMMIHDGMKELGDFFPEAKFPLDAKVPSSFPFMTNNGNTIYFAADDLAGGQGGWDIWMIQKMGATWSKPMNLGPNVNTPGDELCPHISKNGYLYFASNAHKGFGGYDVYRSQSINNVWKDVRNLGNKVNSSFDDMYFILDESKRLGYFSSNRAGKMDIYSAILSGSDNMMVMVNDLERDVVVAAVNDNSTHTEKTPADNNNSNSNGSIANNNNNQNNGIHSNPDDNVVKTPTGGYRPTSNTKTPTNTGDLPIDGVKGNGNKGYTNTTPSNTTTTSPVKQGDQPTFTNGSTVPCAMNFYIGAVMDAETKRPLQGALVYFKNIKTGVQKKISEPTNPYGEYSIILDPLSDYTIAISKTGFKDLLFDVNTGTGGKKTLLGTRAMEATALLERDRFGNVIADGAVVIDNTPTEEELLNPTKSTGKTFSYDANGMSIPKTGYLIQAIVATSLTQEERLELGQYGNIVTEDRGNKKAFRVGIFVDNEHLEKALTAIKATYRDAFKVPVELDNNHLGGRIALSSQVIYPLPPAKPLPVLEDKQPAVNQPTIKEREHDSWAENKLPEGTTPRGSETTPKVKEEIVAFKVQLGAFKDAEAISFSNISHLGMIEKEKRSNGLTYFYISSFKTLAEARTARTKAQEGGVPSPFIVAFKNGARVKISDVVPN